MSSKFSEVLLAKFLNFELILKAFEFVPDRI